MFHHTNQGRDCFTTVSLLAIGHDIGMKGRWDFLSVLLCLILRFISFFYSPFKKDLARESHVCYKIESIQE